MESGTESRADPAVATGPCDTGLALAARNMIAARRAVDGHLPIDLLHDPSLDMLLTLFLATAESRTITAGDLRAATSVGWAVFSRWLQALEAEGLVVAAMPIAHGTDIALTATGREQMCAAMRAVVRSQIAPRSD